MCLLMLLALHRYVDWVGKVSKVCWHANFGIIFLIVVVVPVKNLDIYTFVLDGVSNTATDDQTAI